MPSIITMVPFFHHHYESLHNLLPCHSLSNTTPFTIYYPALHYYYDLRHHHCFVCVFLCMFLCLRWCPSPSSAITIIPFYYHYSALVQSNHALHYHYHSTYQYNAPHYNAPHSLPLWCPSSVITTIPFTIATILHITIMPLPFCYQHWDALFPSSLPYPSTTTTILNVTMMPLTFFYYHWDALCPLSIPGPSLSLRFYASQSCPSLSSTITGTPFFHYYYHILLLPLRFSTSPWCPSLCVCSTITGMPSVHCQYHAFHYHYDSTHQYDALHYFLLYQ